MGSEIATVCGAGNLAALDRLIAGGLTLEEVREFDNEALREACWNGHLDVVNRLIELGLTADDARADDNGALASACSRKFGQGPNLHGHLAVVERLIELGIGVDDARAQDNYALRYACARDHAAVVCMLAASGMIEPVNISPELQVEVIKQIIRAPEEDEGKAETRRSAARVASDWPGIEDTIASLAEEQRQVWDELQYEATSMALRFAD